MEDKEIMAIKLGFESAEEMEKYYDLCRGDFKEDVIMTKDLCSKHVINSGWGEFLNMSREERLEKKLYLDFDGLVEAVKMGDSESTQKYKTTINFTLSELEKCYSTKDQMTMK